MKYVSHFYDINEKKYNVEIGSGTTKEVTLSDTPFVTEIETSDSHIYKPCKYSSATIGMITTDYAFDLYSSTAQQNKVTLTDDNDKIIWVGYVTPNLYSQGYENPEEIIEVECIDALSTLQYFEYEPIGTSRDIVRFAELINHLLSKCNAYEYFYFSDNIKVDSTSTFPIISRLTISEQNFFDEDDEPMKMQEVLEEVCQYLAVTAVAYGNSVYLIDYDAIKNGNNNYYRYEINNIGTEADNYTLVTLSHSKVITGNDYVENGGQLSLDNVYNKVTVKDSLYSLESVIPDIWDDNYLIQYGEIEKKRNQGEGGTYNCFYEWYSNSNIQTCYYDKDTYEPITTTPSTINYDYVNGHIGATVCKAYFDQTLNGTKLYPTLSMTDYIVLCVHDAYTELNILYPAFSVNISGNTTAMLGGKTYFIINGDFIIQDINNQLWIASGHNPDYDSWSANLLYVECRMKMSGLYWNGTSWVTDEATFNLYLTDNSEETEHNHFINKTLNVQNNIDYTEGLDTSGCAIPLPYFNRVYNGTIEFTMFMPRQRLGNANVRTDYIWISNFKIVTKTVNENLTEEEKDSDTEYTNVINEDYVNEMQDIEYNICTWDNKEPNYSVVGYIGDDDITTYLDTVYNTTDGNEYRYEELKIWKLVTQYSTPSVILNLNLKNEYYPYSRLTDHNLSGKIFIVDSITTDYAMAKQELKLIEKK